MEATGQLEEKPKMAPIPAEVETFLIDLHTAMFERDEEQMKRLYDHDFNSLTEKYYSKISWLPSSRVEEFYVQRNMCHPLLMALYCQLYYRHLLARCPSEASLHERYYSFYHFMKLFDYFIAQECSPENEFTLPLPTQWLWDIVDEFVYQFQEFQRWIGQFSKCISENEVAMQTLHQCSNAWRASDVFQTLYLIIEASGINVYLENENSQNDGIATLRNMKEPTFPILLGYFSIISLMRLHVAIGDYKTAFHVARNIRLSTNALYWKVPACHVTLFYNLSFAYMMMRRYQDALRVLSQVLVFLSKSRGYLSTQGYQHDVMARMTDKMYHVVMLCHALSPSRLENSIQSRLQEKLADKYCKLQSDNEEAYKEVFVKACPKFVTPVICSFNDPREVLEIDQQEPLNRQLNVFLKDVFYQHRVFNVRSVAKLYNNLSLSKLANLMDLTQKNAVEIVRSEMLCVKSRAEQVIWKSGSLLDGERVELLNDLDIYLDTDTIHVKNLATHENFVHAFVEQIQRIKDLTNMVNTTGKAEVKKNILNPV
ncbi:eukaryotic translation initiation factor 3 subunit L-like [Hylaeus volcanicus]|uniref:eukaryotic translation initiation factor 3 subunit L-like n=1 Tax=Hylaeus volcanicus TaxID=313075 RepID=UPI0023B7A7CC|nr:eukaryotic translation initiation factor 3 subunit L-like [Hylaeus volcanicus]XP_053992239.1 eukaryotic translation initiation factor 3 subunit L-like [Hylaeus volcanicus]XP_053992240.1 eukaryotic translation initiation factor 3 subunit L-like [Hylaeus volcanicus]